jgi:hypothetical protein
MCNRLTGGAGKQEPAEPRSIIARLLVYAGVAAMAIVVFWVLQTGILLLQ